MCLFLITLMAWHALNVEMSSILVGAFYVTFIIYYRTKELYIFKEAILYSLWPTNRITQGFHDRNYQKYYSEVIWSS